jgi:hypothetical protein
MPVSKNGKGDVSRLTKPVTGGLLHFRLFYANIITNLIARRLGVLKG